MHKEHNQLTKRKRIGAKVLYSRELKIRKQYCTTEYADEGGGKATGKGHREHDQADVALDDTKKQKA